MSIRLIATDLDGTLLRSDGTVDARTIAALGAAREAGIVVVYVTGRPLRWTRDLFAHLDPRSLAVLSNGALVWDVAADGARLVRALEREAMLEVALRVRSAVPGTAFAIETLGEGIGLEPGFREGHPPPPGSRRAPLDELGVEPVLKLLARHEALGPEEFLERAAEAVGGRATVTRSSPEALLEISAPGVSKATTLELLCVDLGITAAEVVAFGDMPNDLALLSWAGLSYAMANAEPAVRAAADRVTASNDEHGVAAVIEAILDPAIR